MSETCEYQIERTLTHVSEFGDYINEFQWSGPGVEEENTANKVTALLAVPMCFVCPVPLRLFSFLYEGLTCVFR